MAQVKLHYIKHKQGYHNMWATCMYMFVFLREYCLSVVIEKTKNESFWNKVTKHIRNMRPQDFLLMDVVA